jgi:hypothetical protein
MTGIPDNFDEFRRKKISELSIKSPEEKICEIEKLMKQLEPSSQMKTLDEIGLKINKKMQTIKGKLIPLPELELGKNNAV